MNAESALWSETRQQWIIEQLVGDWAEDVWTFPCAKRRPWTCHLRFTLLSGSLKGEIKYALWQKFARGDWKSSNAEQYVIDMRTLIPWLNQVAPTASSLLGHSLEWWELSLRSYLVATGRYREKKQWALLASQELKEFARTDRRMWFFRSLYRVISDAYDDRSETEKDIWDMRRMGLAINPSTSQYTLNFTKITQPWLRQLAKRYLQYNTSVNSPGDCYQKLDLLHSFSRFVAERYPLQGPIGIDRACILDYITYLRESGASDQRKCKCLRCLRLLLEVGAQQLQIPGLTKEQIIFDSDLPKLSRRVPREIPEEVLAQLRQHLGSLPTTPLRMVVILLECGLRISELCTLECTCLTCDDRHEWYLRCYQQKSKKEHIIPLVDPEVIATVQAQQEEVRARWGQKCRYLFPSLESPARPFQQRTFSTQLNLWALKAEIIDRDGKLYRFQSHQFRHTVGMRLLNEDVPIETISRLFGHSTTAMTERYAYKRAQQVREELQRLHLKRKTINFEGQIVRGEAAANGIEPQLLRKGIRGQTLPVGGCGRPVVSGPCEHENKCLTCVFWLTSTEDLPTLKAFLQRATRLRQRAAEAGSQVVVANQDRIIPLLQLRVASLENSSSAHESISVQGLLEHLKGELAEMEAGLEEAQEAQLVIAVKHLERQIAELKAQIAALEEPQ